jgi:FkbM family methyltransferase
MFEFQGMWLPDGEKHFPEWMAKSGEIVDGRGTYQIKKWRACLPLFKKRRRAVDVGAHVGFWSLQMFQRFDEVEAFEPVDEFRSCWIRNVIAGGEDSKSYGSILWDDGLSLHAYALGAADGSVSLTSPPLEDGISSGGTYVSGAGAIPMRTLDSFEFTDVDFVKIDCEGYEEQVVQGGRETLLRWKPCVIVEQKQHIMSKNFGITGTPAVDLLKKLGAIVRKEIGGDYIMTWD